MSVNIITRDQWNAKARQEYLTLKVNPPRLVMIHHSETSVCNTTAECKTRVANIQHYHMTTKGWKDIGYNFLIGGDGNVYEGRGWGTEGAHCKNFNHQSIGICVVGSFQSIKPSEVQLKTLRNLLEYGVATGKIQKDYHLMGHRQASSTDCPGNALFEVIKTWPHFYGSTDN